MSKQDFARHVDALVALDKLCFTSVNWNAEGFLRDVPGKWELSFVSTDPNGKVTGYIVACSTVPGYAHINRLAVGPDFEGQGFGSALVTMTERAAQRLGLHTVTLELDGREHDVQGFYERLGYELAGSVWKRMYAASKGKTLPDDRGVMFKKLPHARALAG